MATELKKLGQTVIELEDSLKIISDINALIEKAKEARAIGKTLEIETYRRPPICYEFLESAGTYDLLEDGKAWLSIKTPNVAEKPSLISLKD